MLAIAPVSLSADTTTVFSYHVAGIPTRVPVTVTVRFAPLASDPIFQTLSHTLGAIVAPP